MDIRIVRAEVHHAESAAETKIAAWQEAYAHILPAEYLAGLNLPTESTKFQKRFETHNNFWVALLGDRVIGYSGFCETPEPVAHFTGFLDAIYVHPDFHKLGVAPKLLRVGLDQLIEEGHENMALFCLAANRRARAFYAKWGARFIDSGIDNFEGVDYDDTAMGWDNLHELRDRLDRNEPCPKLSIRLAVPHDATDLGKMKIASWRHTYADYMSPEFLKNMDPEVEKEKWSKNLADPAVTVFFAEYAGVPAGYLVMGPAQIEPDGKTGEFQAIYIMPEFHGMGIGPTLMELGVDWLRERSYEKAIVWCFAQNERAARFYRRLGAKLLKASTWEIGGRPHPDECLGWDSVEDVARGLSEYLALNKA